MDSRSRTRLIVALSFALAVAACSGAATPTPESVGGTPTAGGSVAGNSAEASAGGGGGTNGFEGKLVTTGLYAATWSAIQGAEVDPFNSYGSLTVTSDKGTFGNISVNPDGTVSFGSAAPLLVKNGSYDGTGAQVTLDKSSRFVCAFTVDTDLKGTTDSAILHVSGNMTVHWHPEGVGDMSCP
jgi:hypothetical protein